MSAVYQQIESRPQTPTIHPGLTVFDRKTMEERDYWLSKVSGEHEVVGLPTGLRRHQGGRRSFGTHHFEISHDLCDQLEKLTGGGPFLVYTTLMTTLVVCLHRYSGNRVVTVGSPARRTDKGSGQPANALAIRTEVDPSASFRETLMATRQGLLEAYNRQSYPFDRLLADLGFEPAPPSCPLFSVALALEDLHGELPECGHEVTLVFRRGTEGLTGRVDFDELLHDRAGVERFLGHFTRLLAAGLESVETEVAELALLDDGERRQALDEWSGGEVDYPREASLASLFEARVDLASEAVALRFGDRQLSYGELDRSANGVARRLQRLGVGRGELVGLYAERSPELLAGMLGILKAGGAYVPLDPSFPRERLAAMLEDMRARVVLTQGRLAESLPELAAERVILEEVAPRADRPPPAGAGGDPAYAIYTSGSTGRPKGVMVPQRAVARLVLNTNYVDLSPEDRMAQASTPSFDAATFEIWGAMLAGACLVGVERDLALSPRALADFLKSRRVNQMWLTSSLFNQVAREVPSAFEDLSTLIIGGEALDPTWVRRALEAGGPRRLLNGYGPTESTTFATWHPIPEVAPEAVSIPIGRALANTRIYALDRRLEPVPAGVAGELLIGGDGLALGYLRRPSLTAEKFIPSPFSRGDRLYRTGDLVRFTPDGVVEFLGRFDHQVKLRGFRIELGEIEMALAACSGVREAVVLLRADGAEGDKRLVAYAVPEEGRELTAGELRASLEERFPDYMVPSAWVFLEAFPLTPTGKLDRRALPAPETSREGGPGSFRAPSNPIEHRLAAIWSEVLELDAVGVDDDFFNLGGHSLMATRVASRARHVFGIELPLHVIFENSTITDLAVEVEKLLGPQGAPLRMPPLRRAQRDAPLPLSLAQQRLWFIDQMAPGDPSYNVFLPLSLSGPLEVEVLKRCLAEVVRRHEALRTNFVTRGGIPLQVIRPPVPLKLPVIDLSGLVAAERRAGVARMAGEQAQTPFDLTVDPLLRVQLVRLSETEHAVLVTLHHIVSDGWSLGVLMREIAALYDAFKSARPSPLPELEVQYGDFAAWQRGWFQGPVLEAEIAFWKEQLGGLPDLLELPTDRPRPAVRSREGQTEGVELSGELTETLTKLGQSSEASLFMTLLAAYQTLLYRYTGQRDFAVGTPIAGRHHLETEPLVGFFVNTLVLRAEMAADLSFRQWLARTRETAFMAQAHQDLPFEKLVEELDPQRSLSHSPLFQVMFALQNLPLKTMSLSDLELTSLQEAVPFTAKFDLNLTLFEGEEGLSGWLGYSTSLFDGSTARRLADHFVRLLRGVAADPDGRLEELPLMSRPESTQLLVEWNDTASDPRVLPAAREPLALHRRFERQVDRRPDAVALVDGDRCLSFARLDAEAHRLAHKLQGLGVGPEARVGLYAERGNEAVVGILATLKAGAAFVPFDPASPPERLAFMLRDTGLAALLCQNGLRERLPESGVATLTLDGGPRLEADPASRRQPLRDAFRPDNLAYVIYTSGSSGTPKGAMIHHRSASNLVDALEEAIYRGSNGRSRVAVNASLAFDASIKQVLQLLRGCTLYLVPESLRLDPGAMADYLACHRLEALDTTPSQLGMWIKTGWLERPEAVPSCVLVGGESLDAATWRRLGAVSERRFFNVYGPTECTVDTTVCRVESSSPSLGRPLGEVRLQVLDRRCRLVPVGVWGELAIAGAGLARGYLDRPALTAGKFVPHPWGSKPGARLYRSGDLVRYLHDGRLEFGGRVDHQVKLRGYRLELGEIEAILAEHPGVRQAVVQAVKHPLSAEVQLVAYVVTGEDDGHAGSSLGEFLAERLPDYMIPTSFVPLESLPLNRSGKVDRQALPVPDRVQHEGGMTYVAPRNPIEEMLASIWSEVLGVEQVGAVDNFFDLGGHSLLATQVVARLPGVFQIELPVRTLFERPTIAELAEAVAEARDQANTALPTAIPRLAGEASGPVPLSFAQRRLWFIDQLDPGSSVYNIPAALRLTGPLDVQALERSFTEVARRHQVLRTVFTADDGEPWQVVRPLSSLEFPVVDLSVLGETKRERELLRLASDQALEPFDLSRDALLRLRLLRLGDHKHVLLMTVHHIAADGWSIGLLIAEVGALYEAFRHGRPTPLEELPIQYADYAVWQREWLEGPVMEAELSFWSEQLRGMPTVLELPTNHPRKAIRSSRGTILAWQLEEQLVDELRTLSRREGVTLFMALLAAYQTLLYRYSGQKDFAVGSPIAGRNRFETERLIGFFVNTLVWRADFSRRPSFKALLEDTRERALEIHAHQHLPFEKLVEELQPDRNLSLTPLFQTTFNFQNTPRGSGELSALEVEPVEGLEATTALFDLSLTLRADPEGLSGLLEYSTDLFERTTAERMVLHLQSLLRELLCDPSQPVSAASLMSPAERHQLLAAWNDTTRALPVSDFFHDLFSAQAARTPEATAVLCGGERLSYRELEQQANQLAHHLVSLGVGPEVRVGLLLDRSPLLPVALLGVLKAGGTYVPLDVRYPTHRLAWIVEDAGVSVLASAQPVLEHRQELAVAARTVVLLDAHREAVSKHPSEVPEAELAPAHLAYVIYTSGSTGVPKGVMVSHGGLANYLSWCTDAYAVADGSGSVVHSSLSFDLTITGLLAPLTVGRPVRLVAEDDDVEGLAAELAGARDLSLVKLTPSHLELLEQQMDPREDLSGLVRALVVGGEALTADRLDFWRRNCPSTRLINEYGPTETVVGSCVKEVPRGARLQGVVAIGRPIANTQVYMSDEGGQPVVAGVAGELHLGGAGLARGYLGRPGLTAEKWIPNPFADAGSAGSRLYRTGDLARWSASGDLEFLGRIDHQVKLRGFRIELGEIESVLCEHAEVREAVVVLRTAAGEGRLAAYLLAPEDVDLQAVRELLKSKLPAHMVPASFVRLDAWPLTPNGKIDRRALPEPGQVRAAGGLAHIAPRNPIEEMLADIWTELLGHEELGVDDNFFDLGGHSLLATRVVARLPRVFQVELPVRTLFEKPTIAELAEAVVEARKQSATSPALPAAITRLAGAGPRPLSFAQQRLWFIDQLEPGSSVYNIPAALRLTGPLDFPALVRSFTEVVRRHQVLRTVFTAVDGEPWQVVRAPRKIDFPVVDLSRLDELEREGELLRLAAEQASEPFELSRDVPLRLRLARASDGEHVLLMTVHHIAADGWSIGLMIEEVSALYEAFSRGLPDPLEELSIQYADYAVWQREWMGGPAMEAELEFWREELRGMPTVLELPSNRPRPAVRSSRGTVLSWDLEAETLEGLKTLSRREGATLFMTLLAAYQVLLYRYSAQKDFAVGTPIAGRNRFETERLIGLFVNSLVWRADFSRDLPFKAFLEESRERAFNIHAHQDLPFEKLVEELQPERDLSHTPLFQTMLNFQNTPQGAGELAALAVSSLERPDSTTTRFDLSLALKAGAEGLNGFVEYSTELFDRTTIERMVFHFRVLLGELVSDPARPVSAVGLMGAAERHQLASEWNDTAGALPDDRCLHELLATQAARTPHATAVVCGEQRLAYCELDRRANQLAHYLLSLGVGPEARVGVCLERSPKLVVALVGILKAGAAYVPLDHRYPQERLAFTMEDARVSVLVTSESILRQRPELAVEDRPVVRLDAQGEEIARFPTEDSGGASVPAHLAYVIYTSGSTGRPKGVGIEHRAAAAMLRWAAGVFPREDLSGVLASTSVAFDLSVFELFLPLCRGGRVVLVPDALALLSLAEPEQVTLVNTVPSAIADLVDALPASVRTVSLAGEPLKRSLVRRLYERPTVRRVYNLYGPSEDTTYSTWKLISRQDEGAPAIGAPVADSQAYLLDRRGRPVAAGIAGEIHLGGAGLARGYLGRPGLTAAKWIPNPFAGVDTAGSRLYRTGDLARRSAIGDLEYLGRIDHQVKVRGFRIEPGEIESVLCEHVEVREALVVVRTVAGEKRLAAYLLAPEDVDLQAVRELLKSKLPAHMVPASFVRLDAWPLTPNGKIDRRALPEPEAHRKAGGALLARDRIELALLEIFEDLLGRRPAGVRESFFDLGGHSLLAVRLLARIEKYFRCKLALATLFSAPTVEALAAQIRGDGTSAPPKSPLVALKPEGSRPPLFWVHPVGGGVMCYLELVSRLDPEQPFYAFQAVGLDGPQAPLGTIEAMAERYLEELRALRPESPYHLGGWSLGGLIALEMAQKLEEQGETVGLLTLLDSPVPDRRERPVTAADPELFVAFARDLGMPVAELESWWPEVESLEPDRRYAALLERAAEEGLVPGDLGSDRLRDLFEVFATHHRARTLYRPRPYRGDAVLFRASDRKREPRDPSLGWRRIVRGDLKLETVPGDHYGMLREPGVETLVQKLESHLNGLQLGNEP